MDCKKPVFIKPLHFCSAKIIPLVFDNSLSYYEQLCAFSAKLNSIIDYVNSMSLGVTEFYQMVVNELENNYATTAEFNEFKEYVLELISHIVGGGVGQTIEAGTVYNVGGVDYTAGTGAEIFNSYEGGTANKAAGNYSHAEGGNTAALATGSHTEGVQTIATGNGAHAEGAGSQATAQGAHAEGSATIASATNAHAGGGSSIASGQNSFSHGSGTIAAESAQTAIGRYNNQAASKFLFVIGNGTADNSRSDAFKVDDTGKIYVGSDTEGIDITQLIVPKTQNDYDNLAVKNPKTLYVIIPEEV